MSSIENLITDIVSRIYDGDTTEQISEATGVDVDMIARIEDIYDELEDGDEEF